MLQFYIVIIMDQPSPIYYEFQSIQEQLFKLNQLVSSPNCQAPTPDSQKQKQKIQLLAKTLTDYIIYQYKLNQKQFQFVQQYQERNNMKMEQQMNNLRSLFFKKFQLFDTLDQKIDKKCAQISESIEARLNKLQRELAEKKSKQFEKILKQTSCHANKLKNQIMLIEYKLKQHDQLLNNLPKNIAPYPTYPQREQKQIISLNIDQNYKIKQSRIQAMLDNSYIMGKQLIDTVITTSIRVVKACGEICFGITNTSSCKQQKQRLISYSSLGEIVIDGRSEQAPAYKQNYTIEMKVDKLTGKYQWSIKDANYPISKEINFTNTKKNARKAWIPFIYFSNKGDTVILMQ